MSIETSRPFHCDQDDDDQTFVILSCLENGPQWWQIGRQVAWSLGVWVFFIITSPLNAYVWKAYCNGTCPFWVQRYVGTRFRSAQDLSVEAVLCLLQVFGSLCSVWIWVIKSYSLHGDFVTDGIYAFEVICVFLSLAHTAFERIKFDFSMKHALSFSVFLDCLTIPPIIMQRFGPWAGGSWLTLGYLRAYHCLTPIKRLVELDYFDRILSNFAQKCIVAVLEFILVVFSIAGTLWIMESLGDIEGFSDQFFDSGMGGISFFQMIYFTFVTISTVGFGDYSPTTVLSRTFIIFAILGGVSFFSYISVFIVNLVEFESSGRGSFNSSRKSGRGHILVMGGGVTCGSQTVIETFMRALCRNNKFYDTPDIVLLGQTSCSKEVREMLTCEWAMGYQLQYFLGCPLSAKDLNRVRASEASMVFIIADFLTSDTKAEDTANSLIAAALQKLNPNVQFRLMLCAMHSGLCSDIGLSEFNCFSLESLKAGMLGTSHGCPGFSTMVLNLGLSDLPVPNTPFSSEIVHNDHYGKWLKEYAIGCSLETYGFLPQDILIGLTFKQAAIKITEVTDVLLIAAQINGGIRINPSNFVIRKTTLLYAMGRDNKVLAPICRKNDTSVSSWIDQFVLNRKQGSWSRRQHKKVVRMRTEEEIEILYASSLSESSIKTESNKIQKTPSGSLLVDGSEPFNDSNISIPSSTTEPTTNVGSDVGIPVFGKVSEAFRANGSANTVEAKRNDFAQRATTAIQARKRTVQMDSTKIKMTSTVDDIAILRKQVKQGGHTVIIVQEDSDELDQQTIWEQLTVIVHCLISAKDITPLVVAHAVSALPSRCRWMQRSVHELKLVKISFCVGDVLDPTTLQGAGCHTCDRIITLAPSGPCFEKANFDGVDLIIRSDDKKDENNILLMMVLEEYKQVWQRSDIHIIFDWYTPTSMNLLPLPSLKPTWTRTTVDNLPFARQFQSQNRTPSQEEAAATSYVQRSLLKKKNQVAPMDTINSIDVRSSIGKPEKDEMMSISPMSTPPGSSNPTPKASSSVNPTARLQTLLSADVFSSGNHEDDEDDKEETDQKNKLHQKDLSYLMSEPQSRVSKTTPSSRTLNVKSVNHNQQDEDYIEEEVITMTPTMKRERSLNFDNNEISQDDLEFAERFPRGNCLFAAGSTIPKAFIASLYSMAYYTPGFLELIDALLNPSRYDQASVPALFKVPDRLEGKEYNVAALELLKAGTLPLGLRRPGGIEAGTPFPYVVTLVPTSDLLITSNDSIYVLAEPSWAHDTGLDAGYISAFQRTEEKNLKRFSRAFTPTSTDNTPRVGLLSSI